MKFLNDDLAELKAIEASMVNIGKALTGTRNAQARLRMASDLTRLKQRIDEFVSREPTGISRAQCQHLQSAAVEIDFTVAILRAPTSIGHA